MQFRCTRTAKPLHYSLVAIGGDGQRWISAGIDMEMIMATGTVAESEQRSGSQHTGSQRVRSRMGSRRAGRRRSAARQSLARATVNVKAIFGLKLKRLREGRHFTLAELSQRTGVSTSYLAE